MKAGDLALDTSTMAVEALKVTHSGGYFEAAPIDGTSDDILWTDISVGKLHGEIVGKAMSSMPMDIDPVTSQAVELTQTQAEGTASTAASGS